MANSLYSKARQKFARAQLHWENDTFRAVLVDVNASTGYSVDLTNHEFLSSIPVGCRIAEVALTGRVITADGACDATDTIWPAVPAGNAIEAIVIYKFVTDDTDSPLIAWIDYSTGLPITPNGGDVISIWDNATNRIFRV